MPDPWDEPEVQAWARRVLDELVPMIRDSAVTVSIAPGTDTDVKFAVELGMSIVLDKPIILAVVPGRQVPPKLAAVADAVVELPEHLDADAVARINRTVEWVLRKRGQSPKG